jgi:vacuolar-type H+-ATPase subunit I/STV1
MQFNIAKGSLLETILAILFVVIAVAVFLGAFLAFFAYVFGNIRDRWPYYEKKEKRKVIRRLVYWFSSFIVLAILSTMHLGPISS